MSTVNLSWDAASGAVGYQVDYRITGAGAWTNSTPNEPNTTWSISGLTDNTDYDFRVITICASGTSTGTVIGSVITPNYVWIEDTYVCEQEEVFDLINYWTGFSSPAYLFYDSTSGLIYCIDEDDATSNVFSFDPAVLSAISSHSGGFSSVTHRIGLTDYIYAAKIDPDNRRLYMVGKNTGGLAVYDINSDSFILPSSNANLAYGWDVNTHTSTGNGFNRLSLSLFSTQIIAYDDYSVTLTVFDRVSLTKTLDNVAISTITDGSSYIDGGTLYFEVNGKAWVLVNESSAAGHDYIAIYNLDFSGTPSTINIGAYRAVAFYGSQYWCSGFFDSYYQKLYIFDFGSNMMFVVDTDSTSGTYQTVVYSYTFNNRQGKSNISFGIIQDPITGELFVSGNYSEGNPGADGSPISVTYKIQRDPSAPDAYKIQELYANTVFSTLTQVGGTNTLFGAAPGAPKWSYATSWGTVDTASSSVWSTDGQISQYSR